MFCPICGFIALNDRSIIGTGIEPAGAIFNYGFEKNDILKQSTVAIFYRRELSGEETGKGGYMQAEVEIVEGGQTIKTEKMKLKMVKEFSGGIVIYEDADGRAVLYSKDKKKFTLISIDIA